MSSPVFCGMVDGHAVAFARVVMRGEGQGVHEARFAAGVRDTGGALKADGVTRRFRFPRPAAPSTPGLYTQPGAAFSPEWRYAFTGDTVTRDGNVVLTVPPGSARQLRPDGNGPVTPSTVFGLAGVHVRLAPGAIATADFRLPVEPLPATDPAVATIQAASFDGPSAERDRGVAGARGRGDDDRRSRDEGPQRLHGEPRQRARRARQEPRGRVGAGRQQGCATRRSGCATPR
jgi:hypothetical protein